MKKFLDQPIIKTKDNVYLTLVIIIAPLLNFLSGINIDLYAPSMPSIANYFSVSDMITKNTIAVTILGMMVGCVVFGALVDSIGRKSILLLGVFCYMVASFAAPWVHTMTSLMVIRFLQGIMISTVTIGCRALVIDNITGKRYAIAILYTAIAYGAGPVIGPFIGGIIQHIFDWKANFVVLGIAGGFLLHYFVAQKICYFGCFGLIFALVIAYVFSACLEINLLTLMIPIIVLCISVGFIFPNIMGANLKLFPQNAGIAMATQTTLLALIAALGIFVITYFHIDHLVNLSVIYTVLVLLQLAIFFLIYRHTSECGGFDTV